MSVAVVADSHLGGPGGPARPLLAQLAELPARGCRRLILLGDLFQLWIGLPKYETPDVLALLETLRGLRGQGIEIECIEGNRDFFLANPRYRDAFRVVPETSFEAGGKRYLALHGDGLDRRDWRYHFWRGISKSPVGRLAARALPDRIAQRVVSGTEAALSETNQKHKRTIPEEVLRAYGARRLAEGFDVLLLGHFHEAHRWTVPGGEVRLLDAWFRARRVEWFGDVEA